MASLDYHREMGVSWNASAQKIRSAYRKLAMRWHPDRWMKASLSQADEAKQKFQRIQEAYSLLSDGRKRKFYDSGLYDKTQEEDEGFSGFVEEMLSLMAKKRKEKKRYSLGQLQDMLVDMIMNGQNSSGQLFEMSRREGPCSKRPRVGGYGCLPETGSKYDLVNCK